MTALRYLQVERALEARFDPCKVPSRPRQRSKESRESLGPEVPDVISLDYDVACSRVL